MKTWHATTGGTSWQLNNANFSIYQLVACEACKGKSSCFGQGRARLHTHAYNAHSEPCWQLVVLCSTFHCHCARSRADPVLTKPSFTRRPWQTWLLTKNLNHVNKPKKPKIVVRLLTYIVELIFKINKAHERSFYIFLKQLKSYLFSIKFKCHYLTNCFCSMVTVCVSNINRRFLTWLVPRKTFKQNSTGTDKTVIEV